jgi:hypothetical protein
MKKGLIAFFVLIFLGFFNAAATAADFTEEETTEKDLGKAEEKAYRKIETVKEGGKYKTKFFASALQGYDNNVFLDPRRKADTFSEGILDAKTEYSFSGRWKAFGEVSVHDITYWEATDANLVDTDVKLGFEGKLPANLTFSALNNIEVVAYPDYGDGTYFGDKTGLKLKQRLPHNLFQSLGYEYFYKHYTDRKAHLGWGGKSDIKRVDHRNTFDYELGAYLKKMMLKLSSEFYVNTSNDAFHDYYDYQSVKLGASMIYLIAAKMSAYLGFNKQYKVYENRTLPNDLTKREHDRGYTLVGALYYDVYKNTTLSASYAYRQNKSNYAAQKYSGSITTLGLHCRF